jgi:hypothetical protein
MNRTRSLKQGLKAHDLLGKRKAALIERVGLLSGRHDFE